MIKYILLIGLVLTGVYFYLGNDNNLNSANNVNLEGEVENNKAMNQLCIDDVFNEFGEEVILIYNEGLKYGAPCLKFENRAVSQICSNNLQGSLIESELYKEDSELSKGFLELIEKDIRVGNKAGENKKFIYGNIKYNYDFEEEITSDDGTILGDNKVNFDLNLNEISKYYNEDSFYSSNNDKIHYLKLDLNDLIEFNVCEKVN